MTGKSQDNPKLNREIIGAIEEAISACHDIYQDRAKSFAVILNDLEIILQNFQTKMQVHDTSQEHFQAKHEAAQKLVAQDDNQERMVYARLFHKEMRNLATPTGSLLFIRPLLESVKMADKHGIAVYATEEDAKRSLRGDGYAYATLRIRPEQDITEQRGARMDTTLGCPLLTITNIHISNILKLTYNGIDYPIKDSVIVRTE